MKIRPCPTARPLPQLEGHFRWDATGWRQSLPRIGPRKTSRSLILAILCLFQFLSPTLLRTQSPATATSPPASSATSPATKSAYANAKLTYKIIPAPNHTFCYDVYVEGRLMIHQTSVPALPGAEGFKTKAGAEKVARLVIDKIRKGEMPPTVTIDEMKKLEAIE